MIPWSTAVFKRSLNGKLATNKIATLSSIVIYCLFAICFTVGYFLGTIQSTGWCNSSVWKQNSISTVNLLDNIKSHHYALAAIIFSAPKNYDRRNAIRKTWLSTKVTNDVAHFFVIGSSSLTVEEKNNLEIENVSHSDLIFLPSVTDFYSKLSKKLIETLKWVDKNVNFSFLLKVDDDSFVRLDSLYEILKQQPQKQLYWGFFDGRAEVKIKGRWFEDNWILCDTYLPYAKGGGYLLTQDLVHYLAENSNLLMLYKNEDVSLGTWLAPLQVKRQHDPRFDTEYLSRGCFNSYLITHKQSVKMMRDKHKNLVTLGKMCVSEYRKRLSYIYNWKVPPSLCCIRNDSHIP